METQISAQKAGNIVRRMLKDNGYNLTVKSKTWDFGGMGYGQKVMVDVIQTVESNVSPEHKASISETLKPTGAMVTFKGRTTDGGYIC